MTFDTHANLAVSTIATAPSPATTGTALHVATGRGALFSTPPFNATAWPSGSLPDMTNAEIVRVTNITTDTLTIVRAQDTSTAKTITTGFLIAATVTAKTFTDIEAALALGLQGPGTAVTSSGPVSHPAELLNATSAAFTRTLPTAVGFSGVYVLSAIATNTNLVTLNTTSSQTIDGYASGALTLGSQASGAPYSAVTLISDGTNWRVI